MSNSLTFTGNCPCWPLSVPSSNLRRRRSFGVMGATCGVTVSGPRERVRVGALEETSVQALLAGNAVVP